jgi:Fe2+ or Zn2+ uptake regulation protein
MLKMEAVRPLEMSAELLHHETSQKTMDLSFIVTIYENLTSRNQTHVDRIFSTLNDIET